MITVKHSRSDLIELVVYLQYLLSNQFDCLEKQIIYELTVRLYKRLLDNRQDEYRSKLPRRECLSFHAMHKRENEINSLVAQQLFEKIDALLLHPVKTPFIGIRNETEIHS